jgi:hypothetical protein
MDKIALQAYNQFLIRISNEELLDEFVGMNEYDPEDIIPKKSLKIFNSMVKKEILSRMIKK